MDEQVAWLRGLLAGEESAARAVLDENRANRAAGRSSTLWDEEDARARRRLDEIDSKRRILDACVQVLGDEGGTLLGELPGTVIGLLAEPYRREFRRGG